MVGGNNVDFSILDNQALINTLGDHVHAVEVLRTELQRRGYWVDARYNVNPIETLDTDHLLNIYKMMKNNAIRRAKNWDGVRAISWEECLADKPIYRYIHTEGISRNIRGSEFWPVPENDNDSV